MKRSVLQTALLLLPMLQVSAQYELADFIRLHTLKGSWKTERKTGTLFETWKIVNDSTMLSESYRVANNDTVRLEKVTLSFRNGMITYTPTTAYQNNQQPIPFPLLNIAGTTYNFENKGHDFPQMISYDLRKTDSLFASISGNTNNGVRTVRYDYERYSKD